MNMWFGLGQKARRVHARNDFIAHDEAITAVVRQGFFEFGPRHQLCKKIVIASEIQSAFNVENIDNRQWMSPAHFEVFEFVRRCALDGAAAFLRSELAAGI